MVSLVLRTLAYFKSLLVPVALGVAVASAVIVGALVVGDSMRGSLKFIAMDRIGKVQTVLLAPRWFQENLAKNLQSKLQSSDELQSLVYVQAAMAEHDTFRASEMTLMGVEERFWSLGSIAPKQLPGDEEVILNQTLADKLHAQIGDLVTLRVASQSVVPADSPLGKREQDTIVLPRWRVVDILADKSLARFSLRSDQRPIMNAFANKRSLQNALEIESKVNAIFIANPKPSTETGALLEGLAPQLADLGLRWVHVTLSAKNQASPVLDYYHVTTDQMLMATKLTDAIRTETQSNDPHLVLTYLANGTQKWERGNPVGRNVPYSTISAVDWSILDRMLIQSRVPTPEPTQANWVVVTSWLADELSLAVGDTVRFEYYLPETVDGIEIEKNVDLVVAAIAPLTKPAAPYRRNREAKFNEPPTPFNDSAWTPLVPGITDQESISKWETPFELSREIASQDDEYWNDHRLTPKMFVSREMGVQLFGSRFGEASSIRFEHLSEAQAEEVGKKITKAAREQMSSLGWREIPLRQQQLMAASGTTPFDALFLSLSFFVIIAALLLVALLFRLAIEQRAEHWGLLMATGWTRSSVRRLLLMEGAVVSGVGAALGILPGLGYAYLMLAGLRTWWLGAITVSFLDYYAQPISLVMGWLLGWLAAIVTILLSTRQLRQLPISKLLKGQMELGTGATIAKTKRSWYPWGVAGLAGGVLALGQYLQGQAQAGAFVGAGMLFLISGLWLLLSRLKSTREATANDINASLINASSLASSNAKRAPFRSVLAIGLVAIASFLILSMSLFQSSPNEAGTGGFAFIGKSTHPIHNDLNNPKHRREVLGDRMEVLNHWSFVSMRVRGGDDASCNNLYQAKEPQVLGISDRMDTIDRNANGRSAFAWFGVGKHSDTATPWSLLQAEGTGSEDSPVPVILDQNTALWALHLGGYVGEIFSYTFDDQKVHFRTVAVLQNTILQGSLLIGESNFERLFPSITGYRSFLVKTKTATPPNTAVSKKIDSVEIDKVQSLVENGWSESGLSLAKSDDVLKQLLAVQNTYLGAFQVLGGLGLLLGTIGLGVAQLRSAMERRGELAAMRAIGFTKSRLIWLLTLENGWQLLRGVGIGVGSAALATLPAILNGQPYSGLSWPLTMLAIVIASGLLCSIVAAWAAMRWPLLQALRSDK